MARAICSPGTYLQGKGEIGRLADYAEQVGAKKAYLIVGPHIDDLYHDDIVGSFERAGIAYVLAVFGGECSQVEIDRHAGLLDGAGVVFGIGGGKALDTSKAVAHFAGTPVVIVPTAASTDAPTSRLAVIYHEDHSFDRYLPLPKNPDFVVMDTDVIAHAPVRFLMAGIGDALATYYEAAACLRANALTMVGSHATLGGMALARLCRDTLLADGLKAKAAVEVGACTAALENIIEANTYLSGVGFESGGLAAAHATHDGLTKLEETHRLLHGEKVAFGLLTQLQLENCPLEELTTVTRFMRACGLPTTLDELGLGEATDEYLLVAAEAACAPEDTMHNMPFEVTPADVVDAMKAASRFSKSLVD